MGGHRTLRIRARRLVRLLALAGIAGALAVAASSIGGASAAAPTTELRGVMLVGNNWDGTVDVINPKNFKRIERINVAPDYEGCVSDSYPTQGPACVLNNEFAAEGNPQLVDDMRVSPDGRTIYVSRPSLGDAAALDVITGEILWKTPVSGSRSDHTALSPDGSRLLVSATVANVVEVIDTSDGAIVDEIPTGDFPHENDYSEDGTLIFNGSIGRVITPDDPALDALKGRRWFTIIDADTFEVKKVIDFGALLGTGQGGVRPFHVMPDNRTMYVQLSFFNGFVEYDLVDEKVLEIVELPLSEEAKQMDRSDYPLDSAHHGIALSGDETKICDAGTISDYVAILNRPAQTADPIAVENIIPVGDIPYWATTSADGQYCFVANSGTDNVSVISYDQATEVARIPVGDHPQRMRAVSMLVPKPGKK